MVGCFVAGAAILLATIGLVSPADAVTLRAGVATAGGGRSADGVSGLSMSGSVGDPAAGPRLATAANALTLTGGFWATSTLGCGDGELAPGEQCDDGPLNGTPSGCCDATCHAKTTCDDGVFCNGADTCSNGVCSQHAGNPCAGGEQCNDVCNEEGGNCFAPAVTSCATDDNVCTDDHCDGAGLCIHTANTAPCNDGLFCTGSDVCSGGTCMHAGNPCAGGPECANACNELADNCFASAQVGCSSDGNVCTDDRCDGAGACVHVPNSAPCNDNEFCNGADTCAGGGCTVHAGDPCAAGSECNRTCTEATDSCVTPSATPCSGDGRQCAEFRCDGAGTCASHPTSGGSCNDGRACTINDTCIAGGCVGFSNCPAGSDACAGAGTCNGETGLCDAPHKGEGEDCDDLNPCTRDDRCAANACSGSPLVCTARDECHDVGECDATTGTCSDPPQPAGHVCHVDGEESECDGAGLCKGATCGNGVVESPLEECETGECCNPPGAPAECRFKSPGVQCGQQTQACHEPYQCNGQQESCPTGENTAAYEGLSCSTEDCVVAACHGGNCERTGQICSATVEAPAKAQRNPTITVTCYSDQEGDCAAAALFESVETDAAASAEPAADACATPAATAPDLTGRVARRTKRLKPAKAPLGLRFRTVLKLKLTRTGRTLLGCGNVNVRVVVTLERANERLQPVTQLIRLLRTRRGR